MRTKYSIVQIIVACIEFY